MVRNEAQFVGLEKLVDLESYRNWVKARAEDTELDIKLSAIKKILEQNDGVDVDYMELLLYFITKEDKRVVEPGKKRREKDDDDVWEHDKNECSADVEENDPHYELFLNSLKEHGKAYVLEHEGNGQHSTIIYEEEEEEEEDDESLDKEREPEPRRKLRSATKQKNGPSNQTTPCAEKRNLRNRVESENVERVKFSTKGIVPDPDYLTFSRNLKIVDYGLVFTCEGNSVVYEGGNIGMEEEHNDESDSGVEELDRTSFDRYLNYCNVVGSIDNYENSKFRQRIMDVLRKPYDEAEYNRLLVYIKVRKQEERHKELRHGRDLSCSTEKIGKSYLDHHPGLERELFKYKDEKPRCLNLLRGFFFWLMNFTMDGSFQPWKDKECLAINPESC